MPARKKPTPLKLLDGTHRKHLSGDPALEPVSSVSLQRPAWLVHPYAVEEWERITSVLAELHYLTAQDAAAVATYSQSVADYRVALEEIAADGATLRAGEVLRNHPAWHRQKQAFAMIVKTSAMIGLSPADRSGMQVPARKLDDLQDFLKDAQ